MLPPFFHQTPFFRLLLPFIAGIAVGFYFMIPAESSMLVCVLSMLGMCVMIWKWNWLFLHRLGWLLGIFLNLFFFFAGNFTVTIRAFDPNEQSDKGVWLGVVTEPPLERANSMKATVQIRANLSGEPSSACDERVMTYFRKDSLSRRIRQGDLLIMDATLNPVTNNGNPYEFDYQGYLKRKQIGRSAFVESGNWRYLDSYAQNALYNFSTRIRYNLLDILKRGGLSGNEFAVASALTLGYKADLDDELLQAYSISGAIQILAVSGLHVGIIYLVLKMLLTLVPFIDRIKWLRALIHLAFLWTYALVTGLSPSVLRAVTMFSFIAAGDVLNRRAYIYNSIAVSAFFLLIFNPGILLELGFQFSYLAVITIVYLTPFLYGLVTFKNRILDKIWDLTCLSLAAQAGTAPLVLYYFHQFPTYFLLSNYIVIPAASVVIYGALLLFFVSPVQALLEMFGWLLDKFLYAVNFMIFIIEKLPGSVTLGIRFARWEVFFAYVLIASASVWLTRKHKPALFAVLASIALWTAGGDIRTGQDQRRQQLIVYNAQGNSLLHFIEGRDNTIWYSSRNLSFNAAGFVEEQRTALQLRSAQCYDMDLVFGRNKTAHLQGLYNDGNHILFAGKRLVVFTRDTPPQDAGRQSIRTDIAILTQNVNARIPQIMEEYHPDMIVADASSSPSRIDRWEKECTEAGVKFHRVDRDGAFVLSNE